MTSFHGDGMQTQEMDEGINLLFPWKQTQIFYKDLRCKDGVTEIKPTPGRGGGGERSAQKRVNA